MPSAERLDTDGDEIHVRFFEELADGTTMKVSGWPEAAEDLDLLGPGPKEADGIRVVSEQPRYFDEEQEHISGYTEVVMAFADEPTLERARSTLYDKATERFEYGIADSASDVQDFAGAVAEVTA